MLYQAIMLDYIEALILFALGLYGLLAGFEVPLLPYEWQKWPKQLMRLKLLGIFVILASLAQFFYTYTHPMTQAQELARDMMKHGNFPVTVDELIEATGVEAQGNNFIYHYRVKELLQDGQMVFIRQNLQIAQCANAEIQRMLKDGIESVTYHYTQPDGQEFSQKVTRGFCKI